MGGHPALGMTAADAEPLRDIPRSTSGGDKWAQARICSLAARPLRWNSATALDAHTPPLGCAPIK